MKNPHFSIAGREIGTGLPCFVVAELSGNHHQHFEEAEALVRAAKDCGADAVKLQTYTPDTITMDCDREWFLVQGEDNPADWKGRTLYSLYQTAYTPWEWQPRLKRVADEIGIPLFSAPFDETAVHFLTGMNVPAFKIASYESGHIPLLASVARTGKPVILSVGMTPLADIELAVATLREHGANDVALLHCVTAYSDRPNPADMHLASIRDLADRFGVISGFSDNNAGIDIPIQSVLAGASIVEKHLILDRSLGGPDARFSLNPAELKKFVDRIRAIETGSSKVTLDPVALGEPFYGPINDAERYNQRFRRSIFVTNDIAAGELLSSDNIRVIRPAFGLHSRHWHDVLGKRTTQAIARGTPLAWNHIAQD